VLEAPRSAIAVARVSIPDPAPGEALIRLDACGVCHSDLFVAGLEKLPLAPLILGHEGIGRIEALGGPGGAFRVGDRVGITFLASACGVCDWCVTGRERFCPKQLNSGYTRHGALAGYMIADVNRLARIPDGLSSEQAAPLCCAGWTAYGAIRESGIGPGRTVAVFGMGGLGHLAVQYAARRGARVAAVDVSEEKLEMARALGAEITALAENAGRTLAKEHGGMDACVVLTASPAAIQQAFRALRRNGTLVLVGLSNHAYELPIVDTVLKGVTIKGSFLGTSRDLEEALALGAQGAVAAHVETHGLADAPALLERLRRGEISGRGVVCFA
jgi:propanol-preferring alcohol dehydrogenase